MKGESSKLLVSQLARQVDKAFTRMHSEEWKNNLPVQVSQLPNEVAISRLLKSCFCKAYTNLFSQSQYRTLAK